MPKVIGNLKVFAAASVLFALASFYNLGNTAPAMPGTSLTVAPAASEVLADAPAVATTQSSPRS